MQGRIATKDGASCVCTPIPWSRKNSNYFDPVAGEIGGHRVVGKNVFHRSFVEAGTRRGWRVRTYDPWLTSIRFPNGAGRSDRFSFASSDTFVRKTDGKRRATRRYRNKRWDEHRPGFSGFGSFVISIAIARTMQETRCHEHLVPQERADTGRIEGGKIPRRWKNGGAELASEKTIDWFIEWKYRQHARQRTCRLTMD